MSSLVFDMDKKEHSRSMSTLIKFDVVSPARRLGLGSTIEY